MNTPGSSQRSPSFRSGEMARLSNGEFVAHVVIDGTLATLQAMAETPHYWEALAELEQACSNTPIGENVPANFTQEAVDILKQFCLLIATVNGVPQSVSALVRNALRITRDDEEIVSVLVLSKQELFPPPPKRP